MKAVSLKSFLIGTSNHHNLLFKEQFLIFKFSLLSQFLSLHVVITNWFINICVVIFAFILDDSIGLIVIIDVIKSLSDVSCWVLMMVLIHHILLTLRTWNSINVIFLKVFVYLLQNCISCLIRRDFAVISLIKWD